MELAFYQTNEKHMLGKMKSKQITVDIIDRYI